VRRDPGRIRVSVRLNVRKRLRSPAAGHMPYRRSCRTRNPLRCVHARSCARARTSPRAPGRTARAETARARQVRDLLRHEFVEVPRVGRLDLHRGSLPHAGRALSEEVRGGMPRRVRADVPDRLRRLRVLSVSDAAILGGALRVRSIASLRVQGPRAHHGAGVARACPIRTTRR
jgi:hypothetical protein